MGFVRSRWCDWLARRLVLAALLSVSLGVQSSAGEVLIHDNFNGVGNIDTMVWRIPFGEEGSPFDPGNQFLGAEMLTKRNFARGGGLAFEARMRLVNPPGGLVGGEPGGSGLL